MPQTNTILLERPLGGGPEETAQWVRAEDLDLVPSTHRVGEKLRAPWKQHAQLHEGPSFWWPKHGATRSRELQTEAN